MSDVHRADVCAVALAEVFRGDGEIMASPMGLLPSLGARLAKATFAPDLALTDGVAHLVAGEVRLGAEGDAVVEGRMPYRKVFDTLWAGRRHVVMGAAQIDRYGNQNISCVGDWRRPKAMLLGVRGAPGNTLNHTTSYWVPKHTTRVFVPAVDVVCGVGYDRAAALGSAARFHEIRRVVSNLGVFDFDTSDHRMRLVSVHPGVDVARVVEHTGFVLEVPAEVPTTRTPDADEIAVLRRLDPDLRARSQVAV